MATIYVNLITGKAAKPAQAKQDYFELQIFKSPSGFRYQTFEDENFGALASEPNLRDAWIQACLHTPMGWEAITNYREWKPALPEEGEGFDPYAGNLDRMLGY
jgi:hypothetical protein